jgi:hypothetical protein
MRQSGRAHAPWRAARPSRSELGRDRYPSTAAPSASASTPSVLSSATVSVRGCLTPSIAIDQASAVRDDRHIGRREVVADVQPIGRRDQARSQTRYAWFRWSSAYGRSMRVGVFPRHVWRQRFGLRCRRSRCRLRRNLRSSAKAGSGQCAPLEASSRRRRRSMSLSIPISSCEVELSTAHKKIQRLASSCLHSKYPGLCGYLPIDCSPNVPATH